MVLLPEEAEMTLAELRQMAARQQHQIEAQQQLLSAKEQRLKFLKQQEARHHYMSDLKVDPAQLQCLRDKIEAQELKLRHLRALHGQVEQQRTNNNNLGTELESIQALFSEKEKELNVAVNKVDELTRQLDEIRKKKNRKPTTLSISYEELENLRQELRYQNQTTDQQNNYIGQQREIISQRQKEVAQLDLKIAELSQRLHRKQVMNNQLMNQVHRVPYPRSNLSVHNNGYPNSNVATVEPIQRESQEPEYTRDDLSAKFMGSHQKDFNEFSLKKNDPKYQTLPYNTKFYLKGKQALDDNIFLFEDSSPPNSNINDVDHDVMVPDNLQQYNHGVGNFVPRPFGGGSSSKGQITENIFVDQAESTRNSTKLDVKTTQIMIDSMTISDLKGDVVDSTIQPKRIVATENKSKDAKTRLNVASNGASVVAAADPKQLKEKIVLSCTAVVKPVVPPKPNFPVKPMPPPRQTPITPVKERNGEKNDIVTRAISVLQSKSSNNNKKDLSNYRERLLYYRCVSRNHHPPDRTNSDNSVSLEPRVSTYFPKPSLAADTKSSGSSEVGKWRPVTVQLPIKPKPLTIRKTPGLEPPKLKVQQLQSSSIYGPLLRKAQDNKTTTTATVAKSTAFLLPQKDGLSKTAIEVAENNVPVPKKPSANDLNLGISININDQELFDSLESEKEDDPKNIVQEFKVFKALDTNRDDDSSSSPCDSLECFPMGDSAESTLTESQKEISGHLSLPYHRVKGNLKTEGSIRSPRRVSFDPLALLLDAALEGELELAKKTASEVPNPSASNDEGITALHNAICAGHFDVVAFLVEFGCDVNAQDSDGWTPLHCAASCNNLPIVKFLVEHGACIFANTLSDYETAAEKCEEKEEGFESCSEYLYGLQENMGIMNDGVVYAVYDYKGHNSDELTFRDGDKIAVLRNGDDQESEWWWSRLNDEEGYLPRNLLGLYPRVPLKKD